jgi:phosphoenolpyruvate carboxykinase (ATP)
MKLSYTRAMVQAALEGELTNVETVQDEIFGLNIPVHVTGVPDEVLQPQKTWADKNAYEAKAKELAAKFRENFKKFADVSAEIAEKGAPLK